MKRCFPVIQMVLGFALAGSISAGALAQAVSRDKTAEYVKRLSEVSPRDADGFYRVGQWCEQEGLNSQAIGAYERAIRIDPDHQPARAALGYTALGTGWVKGKPRSLQSGEGASDDSPSKESPQAGADSGTSNPSGDTVTRPEIVPKPEESNPEAEAARVEQVIAAKKKWAKEAGDKLGWTFSLHEDDDFLIHTTFPSSKARELASWLRKLKSLVLAYAGRVQGPIWPTKLQFFYLRATTECMQFSEGIDGKRFPEGAGFYIQNDPERGYHIVFCELPEKDLAFFMGWSALERMGNSNRFVGWWIRDGIGGLAAGNTIEGRKEKYLEQAFNVAGAEIKSNPEGTSVFNILGTKGYGASSQELNRSQAITLVAYLFQMSRSKFQKVVADLKSSSAPVVPKDEDKFFFSQYTAFQEKSITTNYRQKLEKIDQGWKEFVLKKAAEIDQNTKKAQPTKSRKNTAKNAARSRNRGGRNRNTKQQQQQQ